MTKEQFMIEEISKEIVLLLMEEHQMDMREALKALYTSDTYSRLINLDTGLYAQSTAYVYEYLEKELVMGKMVYYYNMDKKVTIIRCEMCKKEGGL